MIDKILYKSDQYRNGGKYTHIQNFSILFLSLWVRVEIYVYIYIYTYIYTESILVYKIAMTIITIYKFVQWIVIILIMQIKFSGSPINKWLGHIWAQMSLSEICKLP